MADLFRNKYRIPSIRLQNWDYRWAGVYFITFCTRNREHYFGTIENGRMQLSAIGIIADVMWHEIINHAKNVELDAFVVMPNHVHGILILKTGGAVGSVATGHAGDAVETGHAGDAVETGHAGDAVETGHALSLQPPQPQQPQPQPQPPQPQPQRPQPQPPQPPTTDPSHSIGQQRFQHIGNNSVSSIIGSYKSAVSKHAHRLGYELVWQTGFYDHIIRDQPSFEKIQTYINENPMKWKGDTFFRK